MSERKVLNKYYPPDFDPSKIPRLKQPKDRQYTVRLMAPFSMKCTTCGEYIYKGKKFNARKETVRGENYLGILVFRFYIRCTRCLAEITFKTDPESTDYAVENGATRNFQAFKLAEEQAEREKKELEEQEANNPMMLLENRTKASKNEMEILESLEEIRDLNQRQANVDFDKLLKINREDLNAEIIKKEEEDEAFIQSVFGKSNFDSSSMIKRLPDSCSDEDEVEIKKSASVVKLLSKRSSDILFEESENVCPKSKRIKTDFSVGFSSSKSKISALVKIKQASKVEKNLVVTATNKSQALSLLENYSDSDSDNQ